MRDRIDELRRLLLDAFMAEDHAVYTNAVLELEKLIGVEPGRNHKDVTWAQSHEKLVKNARRAGQFRWGNKSIEAEIADGILTYSIKHE